MNCDFSEVKNIILAYPLNFKNEFSKCAFVIDELINNQATTDTITNQKVKRSTLYEQVFMLHKTSRKAYFNSYVYYQQHPDLQKELFDSLAARLQKKEIKKTSNSKKPA